MAHQIQNLNVSRLVSQLLSYVLIREWRYSWNSANRRCSKYIWVIYNFIVYEGAAYLTHWRRVTHICVSKLTSIGSDNGLSPVRRQAIIWTNAWIFSIGPSGTNFSEILIEIHTFSFKKIHLKKSSGKWRPYCLGLNVLRNLTVYIMLCISFCSAAIFV